MYNITYFTNSRSIDFIGRCGVLFHSSAAPRALGYCQIECKTKPHNGARELCRNKFAYTHIPLQYNMYDLYSDDIIKRVSLLPHDNA